MISFGTAILPSRRPTSAPIGLRQLECVVETPPPLAGEDREDTAERQQAKRRQRLPAGRNGQREAHRREEHVDEVDALTSFGDPRPYFLAPGGRFEDRGTAGWRLSGNAQYNNPGCPYALFSASDIEALRLRPGGSATSPAFCVDLDYPSLRFFLADFEARGAELEVEVIYPDMAGDNVFARPVPASGGARSRCASRREAATPTSASTIFWSIR